MVLFGCSPDQNGTPTAHKKLFDLQITLISPKILKLGPQTFDNCKVQIHNAASVPTAFVSHPNWLRVKVLRAKDMQRALPETVYTEADWETPKKSDVVILSPGETREVDCYAPFFYLRPGEYFLKAELRAFPTKGEFATSIRRRVQISGGLALMTTIYSPRNRIIIAPGEPCK